MKKIQAEDKFSHEAIFPGSELNCYQSVFLGGVGNDMINQHEKC